MSESTANVTGPSARTPRAPAAGPSATWATWRAQGCPLPPPPALKAAAILELARCHGLRVFVETGTYQGDTLAAVRAAFEVAVSLELDPDLHKRAQRRFAGDPRVVCLLGDSARLLPSVLARIDAPALFWLDAHYSGAGTARAGRDTPVLDELLAILRHPVKSHLVLVDDARLFGIDPAYPSVRHLIGLVSVERPDCAVDVVLDAIRIFPGERVARPA